MGMKKAAIINALGKYSRVLFSIIVSAILARILSPDDHGIIAIILVFSTFFTTLSDMGFGAAIVQNKNLCKGDIDSIFSLTVYISVGLAVFFILLSYPISIFYNNEVYVYLGLILSISVLFNALNMVPNGMLYRDKKFVVIAVRTVLVCLFSSVVTVLLAFKGFRFYALALDSVITALLTFVWNYKTTKPRFHFVVNKQSINKVLSFSGYQFAFNLVNYFSRNLDNLLTGRIMGSAELGFYNKAYTLMLYPVNNLTGVISPVLHPILSDYQNQKEIIYSKFKTLVKLLAILGVFTSFICFLSADEIIELLYGPKWKPSVDCFRFLAIAITPQMINSSMGAIFQSLGNTKLLFKNSCINTGITIIAILAGVFAGKSIVLLSLFVAIAYIIHFITASYMLVSMGFKYKMSNYIRNLLPELIMCLFLSVCVFLYRFTISNVFLSLLAKVGFVFGAFIVIALITGEYKVIKDVIRKKK